MRVKMILPALTEAKSPFWRPIKYSLFPPLGLATLAAYLSEDDLITLQDEHVETLDLDDEPDLVRRDLTGAIEEWIDVGLPEAREVRKAAGRARSVHVLAYGGRAVELWWQDVKGILERQDGLSVAEIPMEASRALAALAGRSMRVQVTVQEGDALVTDGSTSVRVELRTLKAAD